MVSTVQLAAERRELLLARHGGREDLLVEVLAALGVAGHGHVRDRVRVDEILAERGDGGAVALAHGLRAVAERGGQDALGRGGRQDAAEGLVDVALVRVDEALDEADLGAVDVWQGMAGGSPAHALAAPC